MNNDKKHAIKDNNSMKTNRTISILLACLASVCLGGLPATAGVLLGSQAAAPASVNLTAEGTQDWAHWGLSTATDFDQKSGVANQISNFTQISGSDTVARFDNALAAFSWTDGTPTASATGTTTGVYTGGLDDGFEFTVAADTTTKFLKVYAGCWNAQARFEATLSDGSAAAYVDETLDDYGSQHAAVYAIKFAANSAGQTLTIRMSSMVLHGGGNCTILAASLGTPPPGPTVMGASAQVESVTVYDGSEASFSFVATNNATPPALSSYQWYKNSQLVANVTGTQFTFFAGPSDNGAHVYCVATLPAALNPNNLSPLTSATGTVTVLPGIVYTNGLKVEFFSGATRQNVEAGNVGPATGISMAASFELPVNEGLNNYTRRVSGYFIPPASGAYVFFLSADDDADLYLSTDADPVHKRLIAQEENWSNSRQWVSSSGNSSLSQKRSDQWSPDQGATTPYGTGISLTAGQRYYLESVQHQGTGGDNFAVTYKLIAEADPLDDDAPLLQATNHNIALMTGPVTNLVWATQPVSVTNSVGRTVTFTARATSDSEFQPLYQWYRNNSPITGATAANYVFTAVLEDNNTQWHVTASTAVGGLSITSSVVSLTVQAATFPQGLITWEDQDPAGLDQSGMLSPNPYTDAQGLPTGVTATFYNFNSWNADPQHTPGGTWLVYGDNTLDGDASLTFNMPVALPSFWVTTGPYGNLGSWLTAYLNGVEQFAYTNTQFFKFTEVTGGAKVLIDKLIFNNYVGSEIDDILIVKPTSVISFSDQIGNDGPANPNPYSSAQGLWSGVTATFDQFNNWNGSTDHTPDTSDNYLLYGANYDAGGIATIMFNTLVEVPSLWVSTEGGGQSGKATLKGYLKNVEQFTYTVTSGWVEVTAGAGKPIDSIRFIDYGDSWIDDITVNAITNAPAPPAQAQLSLVKTGGGALTLTWTGQGRLEESSAVAGGWATSANQANPQALTVGPGSKFYRIVYP
jgi:hypothetical protein